MSVRHQTIFRHTGSASNVTVIRNDMIRDKRLSIAARGVLAFILSFPQDWKIYRAWLRKELNLGRDRLTHLMAELEEAGYCQHHQPRAANGQMMGEEWVFHGVSQQPLTENPSTGEQQPPTEKPVTGNPVSGSQHLQREIHPKGDSTKEVVGTRERAPNDRGTRLPKDWSLPDDWKADGLVIVKDEALLALEADKFRDYWLSLPGPKGRKLDWKRTWLNWCRSAKPVRRLARGAEIDREELPAWRRDQLNRFDEWEAALRGSA